MNAERWQQVKQLLDQAIACDVAERSSFLDRACAGDSALRSELESLLLSHEQAGSGFLRAPVISVSENVATETTPAREHRIGAYQLVEEIGRGGMGEVYRAVRADGQYQKEVAIKLIRSGFESSSLIERFRNERQILASLDHPNIARLLDGGTTAGGVPYLVMELVDAISVDRYCDEHQLSITEKLRLFRQVCEAVQYAHGRLVIHRDLKPSNILVTKDGVPKLLDFGIAKLLDPSGSTGTTLARPMTPEYASPEQIRGEPVTAATDVYSLGVVLYQLLTGRLPYPGDTSTPHGLARAICEDDPIRPSAVIVRDGNKSQWAGSSTPERISSAPEGSPAKLHRRLRGDLDNIILTALRKEPSQRYASVKQFSEDIRCHLGQLPVLARKGTLRYRGSKFVRRHRTAVAASGLFVATLAVVAIAVAFVLRLNGDRLRQLQPVGAEVHRIESLAVLPLQNLSKDPEQEYFSDGMTDELITNIAKFGALRVISHTSVERYKQMTRPLPEIARELGVDAVVEGTVMRSGDRVRITAQLIDARSDQHLWAESYERDLQDILALQDEVARRIAVEVGTKLAAGQQTHLVSARVVNSAAHEAYLKGNFYWGRSNCDGSKKGLEYYQEAVAKDSAFAPAYVGVSQAYFTLGEWGCWPLEEADSKSKAAARRALELDDKLGAAHAWLGTLAYFHEWDWDTADREYKQAIDLDPNYAPAHLSYAVFLVSMGKQEQGLAEMRKALELDPTAELTNMVSVHILYLARKYDNAIEQAKNAIQFYPDSWGTYYWLGAAYENKGMYEQAIEAYLKSRSLNGATPQDLEAFRNACRKSGIRGYWQHVLDTLSESDKCWRSGVYAHLGDKERAIEYLNQAFQHRCHDLRSLKVDGVYDSIREDPRFQDLIATLRL